MHRLQGFNVRLVEAYFGQFMAAVARLCFELQAVIGLKIT
jgi:hypothetical protein